MDSNRIKRLAMGVRTALRNEVSARLDSILAEGSMERLESPSRVSEIEEDIRTRNREEVVDRAAYTWFNRLCALRFMDANGYTPVPVVTPRDGQTQPAILADAAQGFFDPEYDLSEETRQSITDVLTGSKASANAAENAYSLLLQAVCNHYAKPMPYLFAEEVTSSLLVPQGLLSEGSIISRIVAEMDEDACTSVEVLGWLYQFYIAERKDEVFAGYKKRKKAQAADIAPATQLFTPDWIVRYMIENSLGRLWMLNNPDSELADFMDYYIAPEGEEPFIPIGSAEEIQVLDPACGSGHILVYAFDLLMRMYEEDGWDPEDAVSMILENNLSGFEIDRRAAEIASFALEMKAREYDQRFLERNIDARIKVLEPITLDSQELLLVPQLAERKELLQAMAHLDQVGSLYMPDGWDEFVLQNELEHVQHDGSLFAGSVVEKVSKMLDMVQALNQIHHIVVANPPYMGSNNMNPWLSGWVKEHYPNECKDLCTCFIERGLRFAKRRGSLAMITASSWMFISSFEKLRAKLIDSTTIISMIQQSTHGYANVTVPTCMFVLAMEKLPVQGTYIRLEDFDRPQWQQPRAYEAIHNPDCGWFYRANSDYFKAIPGWPIAYWASEGLRRAFATGRSMGDIANPLSGITTGDNASFIHCWWECAFHTISLYCLSIDMMPIDAHWFPCSKGGEYRKWYGNRELVMRFDTDARKKMAKLAGYRPVNLDKQFLPGVTWTGISSGSFACRISLLGTMFDHKGPTCIPKSSEDMNLIAGALNSSSAMKAFEVLSPTLDYRERAIGSVPLPIVAGSERAEIDLRVEDAKGISRIDWDAFETSWDFSFHPLLSTRPQEERQEVFLPGELRSEVSMYERLRTSPAPATGTLIADEFARWKAEARARFDQLKANEEELNRIFARIYRMEGEVPIEVPDDKVSVHLAERARDARSLISYGVGCMLGRYSTEKAGLVLADQEATLDEYRTMVPDATFLPDDDNVLPVLAEEWFDDDIVTGFRKWLAHAFGEKALSQNVAWLEESIGRDLRNYFCRDFYADHLKVYQKRPIYWMFQSPKKSFQCLVYMHRYNPSTVGTVLSGYLRELQAKLRNRLAVLESKGTTAADVKRANKIRTQIAELEDWERNVMKPLADERIAIDLDDGVKVNYNKFPHALAKVAGLSEWR